MKVSPAKILALSFVGAALLGGLVLRLPAAAEGAPISFLDALFQSTSAVCVTGLATIDVGAHLSPFGEAALLILIQAGGLGIVTLATFFSIAMGAPLTLHGRQVVQEAVAGGRRHELLRLVGLVALFTAAIEGVGAAVLFARFSHDHSTGAAAWLAVFHAVSAFCNAGFSNLPENLIRYADSLWVTGTVMALIVLGGLGFVVLAEISGLLKPAGVRRSLHTSIVLEGTALLLVAGFAAFLLLEWGGAYAGADLRGKVLRAAFQAVTPRTAGFNTVDQAALSDATLAVTTVLMFIGGAPGSTAGGIKVTTAVILVGLLGAMLGGREEVTRRGREIPRAVVFRAMIVFGLYVLALAAGSFVLLLTEAGGIAYAHRGALGLFFETASALGTVGLSTGVTPDLTAAGKCVIIAVMLLGRIGPIGVVLAFAPSPKAPKYRYPPENVLVG